MSYLNVELMCGSEKLGTPVEHRVLRNYKGFFKGKLVKLHYALAVNDPATTNLVCAAVQEFARPVGPPDKVRPIVDFIRNPDGYEFYVPDPLSPGGLLSGGGKLRWQGNTPVCPQPFHAVVISEVVGRRTPEPYRWDPVAREALGGLEKSLEQIAALATGKKSPDFVKLQAEVYELRRMPILELVMEARRRSTATLAGCADWLELMQAYRQEMRKLLSRHPPTAE